MDMNEVIQDLENPQFNIEVEISERSSPYNSRGRVSASDWNDYYKSPRIYVHPKGETILENLFIGRHNRPYKMYRELILPTVLEELGWDTDTKLRWSQKAGCTMCPCSPGFIVTLPKLKDSWDLDERFERDRKLPTRPASLKNDYEPYDVFVTISRKEANVEINVA